MNKGCQKAPLQGKELRNARKLRKVVAIYKTNKLHAFYKQFFYKQRQTKIGKKIKQKLSKTLRLDRSVTDIRVGQICSTDCLTDCYFHGTLC